MGLDLQKDARALDKFHLSKGFPEPKVWEFGPYKVTKWTNIFLPDGSPAWFTSRWVFNLQWYRGTAKCDGSRTYMYWFKQLEDGIGEPYKPDPENFVLNTASEELWAFRWRKNGRGETHWNNMGGS